MIRCVAGLLCALATVGVARPDGRPVIHPLNPVGAPLQGPVWSLAQSPSGALVVGANDLAVFDGYHWQKVDVPGAYGFRALAAAKTGRVYVGAIDTLGYIEPDEYGVWQFQSLRTELNKIDARPLGDVWGVQVIATNHHSAASEESAPETAIWITKDRAIRWDGSQFQLWKLPAEPHLTAFPGRNCVLVYQQGVGLLQIGATGDPSLLLPDSSLPKRGVAWIVPPDNARPDYLIGLDDAAYRWNAASGFTVLPELSLALQGALPSEAAMLGDDTIAIATLKRGVVVADTHGRVIRTISTNNGLPDDTVSALHARADDLVIATGNSLSHLAGVTRAVHFDRDSGLGTGVPLKVLQQGGIPYVLTSKGLLRIEHEGTDSSISHLHPMLKDQVMLRDAASIGPNVWIAGFGGAWRIGESDTAEREYPSPADVFLVAPTQRQPGGALVLEASTLKLLTPSAHGGWAAHQVAGNRSTPVSMREDEMGNVWVSTVQDGIFRYAWTRDGPEGPGYLQIKRHYRPGYGLPRDTTRPVLAQVDSRLHALTPTGTLRLQTNELAFEPLPELAESIALAVAPAQDSTAFWLVQRRELTGLGTAGILRSHPQPDGTLQWEPLDVPGLDAIQPTGLWLTDAADPTAAGPQLWFTGPGGLLRVEAGTLRPSSVPAPLRLTLRQTSPGRETAFVTAGAETARLEPNVQRLEFQYAAPTATTGDAPFYQTRLTGPSPLFGPPAVPDWSPPLREPVRDFTSLAAGTFRFQARPFDRFGRTGPTADFAFTIPAPWYARLPALAAYLVLLVLAGTGTWRWRVRRLHEQNEKLNRLVAERTRELELSSTAKSEFLENISHELRNPLNGLMGMMGRLQETDVAEPQRGVLRTLQTCAQQMSRAFEDVLGFSKLEYGYVKVEKKPFRLRPALDEILGLHAAAAQQRGCELQLHWPPDLTDGFTGDRAKLKTVVSNFVGNALKYAPGHPVEIQVEAMPSDSISSTSSGPAGSSRRHSAATEPDSGSAIGMVNLVIEVRDHGPGIPPEEQELIFKKFVRGSDAKRKHVAGTGLGLASCRVLAKLMNGSVGLDSEAGTGSTFYLKLLLPTADPATLPRLDATANGPGNDLPRTALIVEDEAYNQAVLEGIALELGYRPDLAADAEQAIGLLGERDYSVVFLDWELPGAKGGDVARALRARENGSRPVILATTAHDSDEMRERCRAAGMDGFLLKPFNAGKVRRMLGAVAERRLNGDGEGLVLDADDNAVAMGDFDRQAFGHFARARPEQARESVQVYCRAVDLEAAILRQAVAADNLPAIKQAAHRLRSLGGLLGAREFTTVSGRLEDLALAGTAAERAAQWRLVEAACEQLKREVTR